MCGIAGTLRGEREDTHDRKLVAKLDQALQRRGPDDVGQTAASNTGASCSRYSWTLESVSERCYL